MKYYAVTDDPNELMHYGRKGMKWGQHIFGDKPRSAAYRRASSKLSRSMRNGIAKAKANWARKHSPTVLRAKAKAKAAKQQARAARKEEKFMKKAIQRAREGRLRYGKLTDEQVRRVTERLALERNARQLGSTEKPKFKTRLKEAVQEGMLQGATRGGAAYIEERWRAKGKYAAQKKYGVKIAKQDARDQIQKNRVLDRENEKKRAREEAREEKRAETLARESYEYGAVYDNKGRLNYSNKDALARYYKNKYIDNQSTTKTTRKEKRQQRKLANAENRNREQQRKKYTAAVHRIETAQKNAERDERAREKEMVKAQSQASYEIMRTTPQSQRRKSTNRPYVRVRRSTGNPLKG